MNIRSASLLSATLAAGLAFASAASAEVVANLQSTFSFAFKVTTSVYIGEKPVSGEATESFSKAFSISISQRDILESMIEENEISGPLAGWSIVARTTSSTAEDVDYRLFAVKKGQPDHALDDEESDALDLELGPTPISYKIRSRDGQIVSGGGTMKSSFFGAFNADDENLSLGGIITMPFTYKKVSSGEITGHVLVPGKTTLTVYGGVSLWDPELGELPCVIKGHMDFSSHKVTAVNVGD